MKYYKDQVTNEIYAYAADGSQDAYIKTHLIEISESEADIIRTNASATQYENYLKSLSYIERRQIEYPPITDYLDAIVKNDSNQLQAYIDACNAVKEKYPKQ